MKNRCLAGFVMIVKQVMEYLKNLTFEKELNIYIYNCFFKSMQI
jgi:hypothetical protein